MSARTLSKRLRDAHAVRATAIYLGVSWFVLQFVDTLQGMLSLPEWLGPTTIVLLGVGLLLVVATAWIQSLLSTTAAEEAGEIPTDWEIAPAEAFASIRAVNSGTVLARWLQDVGEDREPELDVKLRIAGGLDARFAVTGSDLEGRQRRSGE